MKQIKAFMLLQAYLSYDTWIKIFQQYIQILNDNFVKLSGLCATLIKPIVTNKKYINTNLS